MVFGKKLSRTDEQKRLWEIQRKVEELRRLLKPLSAEETGAPEDFVTYFRVSHIIAELSFVERELQDAMLDAEHWFNMLVFDPKGWTHPWQKMDMPVSPESMLEKKLSLAFVCKNCGANPATLNLPDDHTDDSIAVCKECRFPFGKFWQIKSEWESYMRRAVLRGDKINLDFGES